MGSKGVGTSETSTYFGIPDIVRLDPEGSLRSHELASYFDKQGFFPDVIPAEAHWNLSHVERCNGWIKKLLAKLAVDDEYSPQELLAHARYIWNHRESVRGFSPFQHALGRTPGVHDLPLEMMQHPDEEITQAHLLRTQAGSGESD